MTEHRLYEYADPRKGEHPDWGTKIFDYGKNGGTEFPDCKCVVLDRAFPCGRTACGCGGIDAVSGLWQSRTDEWVPNKYGGNKNLEAIEFFKHLNSVVLGRNHGTQ